MRLLLATQNKHKVEEFSRILTPLGWEILPQDAVCPELDVEETGTTFTENARLKAMALYRATGFPTVADDSGLCVDALDGAPGVYSARYAGEGHDSDANINKLLEELRNVPPEKRTAQFVCSICTVFDEKDIVICEGRCTGTIGFERHGNDGFGYDPVFMVGERSFAELSGAEKDKISHRGMALRELYALLKNRVTEEE